METLAREPAGIVLRSDGGVWSGYHSGWMGSRMCHEDYWTESHCIQVERTVRSAEGLALVGARV